jgi:peptide/nickel transport system substrate-binding protein
MKQVLQLWPLLLILPLLLVLACGDDEDEATTTTAPTATAKPEPVVVPKAAAPTATAMPEPVVVPKAAAPTATVAPQATEVPKSAIFDEDRFGGVLRWVPQGGVGNLDSMTSQSAITRGVGWHFWGNLLQWDQDGVLQPDMLESWDIDGRQYTFTLRDGLTWHDGTAVLPEDVDASTARWRETDKAFAPHINKRWESWTTLNDKTFRITLTEPTALLLIGLGYVGGNQANIMPKETAEKFPPGEIISEFTASGPYKFVSWDPGNKIILERYEDYVPRTEPPSYRAGAKLAYYDRLEMREIPDQETRVAAVLTGEVDYLDVISSDFLGQALNNPDKVKIHIGRPGAQPNLMFNMLSPLTGTTEKGKKMRLAIRAALNAEEVMKGYGALWDLCPSLWHCGTVWEEPGVNEQRYNQNNPELAKQLLQEAGYAGEPIKLVDPTDFPTIHPISVVVRAQLERVGINVEYIATDIATQAQMQSQPDSFHLMPSWYSSALYHPLVTFHFATGDHTLRYPEDSEAGAKFLALQDQLAAARDQSEVIRLAGEMAKVWWDDPKDISFGNFFQLRVYNKDIMNVDVRGAPVGSPMFLNQWWGDPQRRSE